LSWDEREPIIATPLALKVDVSPRHHGGSFRSLSLSGPAVARKSQHLDDALGEKSVELSGEAIVTLEESYLPHAVIGFR
jgi:hypothetical protein